MAKKTHVKVRLVPEAKEQLPEPGEGAAPV